jgi:vacuolar-type H+-ATPase subunit H
VSDEGGGASRSTEPAQGTSAATDISLREYFEALRHSDDKVDQWIFRFYEERDRRINEVNIEREKALKIKETADLAALGLAREIQTYKDEKANELREQISSERGHYASKEDVKSLDDKMEIRLAPLIAYVAQQQGRSAGVDNFSKTIIALLGLALVLAGLVIGLR